MACPSCNAETPPEATSCASCGAALVPARRRQSGRRTVLDEVDTPFSRTHKGINGAACRAYRISVYGLVPGLGLILGPVAIILAILARRRGRGNPEFTAHTPARAAIVLGTLITLTNWIGVLLMVLGLA
jgi:hypothetical protein